MPNEVPSLGQNAENSSERRAAVSSARSPCRFLGISYQKHNHICGEAPRSTASDEFISVISCAKAVMSEAMTMCHSSMISTE